MLRAYADDIALVIKDYNQSAGIISQIFDEFGEISGLRLNIKKTLFIPLWPLQSKEALQALLREECPRWKDIGIDNKGKLLGIVIGPGADDHAWTKPLRKFENRVQHWSTLRLGLHWNVRAFNVFIVPTLEFVAQLCVPPEAVCKAIIGALRRLASGPGNWCTIKDLEQLHLLGLPSSFRTLQCTAKAAKFRVTEQIMHDLDSLHLQLIDVQLENMRRPI